jgi:hypothetical protein
MENAVEGPAMGEQSHREEMSAAIRAQRERQGTARPPTSQPAPLRERKRRLMRFLRREE